MKNLRLLLLLPLFSLPAHAQGDLFCNAGLRPDGYIDLSAMPAAPEFPAGGEGSATSAPITVSLPVTGIAHLSVQITIPALKSPNPGPIYSVTNGLLTFNGFAAQHGEILALSFSQPVSGFGLVANSVGRQADFTLQTDAPGEAPPAFANSADALTIAPKFYSIPLEQVDLQAGFSTAFVLFGGSADFGTPGVSNLRVQSTGASQSRAVPRDGLQQWLVSESVQSPFLGDASSWPDQSGNEHRASQTDPAHQPVPVQGDGNACRPAFMFTGKEYFNFQMPIDGWQQMTVILVAKSAAEAAPGAAPAAAAAIFWNENAYWGNTFVTPQPANAIFRFGTTQVNNQPAYARPSTVGQDFTITRAVHDGDTDSLYVDGLLAFREPNKLPVLGGTTGSGYIGRGLGNTYFKGEISEVLIYNRVLSADESAAVEYYLRNKFGTR